MSANGDFTDRIVLGSDADSDGAVQKSAPVSPTNSFGVSGAGLLHAGGTGRIERSVNKLAWQRRLAAGPVRLPDAWPLDEASAMSPPVRHVQTQLSMFRADVSPQDCSSPAGNSLSPLPLRERLRQRSDIGQHSGFAKSSFPTLKLAGHSSNFCRDFGEPATAIMGGGIWRTQDQQPSGQAFAGLETHTVLDSESLRDGRDHCISLLTP